MYRSTSSDVKKQELDPFTVLLSPGSDCRRSTKPALVRVLVPKGRVAVYRRQHNGGKCIIEPTSTFPVVENNAILKKKKRLASSVESESIKGEMTCSAVSTADKKQKESCAAMFKMMEEFYVDESCIFVDATCDGREITRMSTLPPGYTAEIRFRLTGRGAGRHYVVYHSPQGKKLRSSMEVFRDYQSRQNGPLQ